MNKDKLQEMVDAINNVSESFEAFNKVMNGGPSSYYFERMIEFYEGCMKVSKFKIGYRVELKETVTDGWQGRNHFMVAGAKATIMDVDYYKGEYRYDIMFDKETWIKNWGENKGEVDIVDKRHFCFGQKLLRRIK